MTSVKPLPAAVAGYSSLVRYDTPILITSVNPFGQTDAATNNAARSRTNKSGADVSASAREEEKVNISPTADILNSILPPREWTDDGSLWVQYVSSTPATRTELVALTAELDQRLADRRARDTGVCPIREELYSQCFDELIRQVTIHCSERGLLLVRVRDELRLTIATYQTLYESAIAFGMRKALVAEQSRVDMTTRTAMCESAIRELQRTKEDILAKTDALVARETARRVEESQRHRNEVEGLVKLNSQLKKELETILQIPTSSASSNSNKIIQIILLLLQQNHNKIKLKKI